MDVPYEAVLWLPHTEFIACRMQGHPNGWPFSVGQLIKAPFHPEDIRVQWFASAGPSPFGSYARAPGPSSLVPLGAITDVFAALQPDGKLPTEVESSLRETFQAELAQLQFL